MNEFERRIRELLDRLGSRFQHWWGNSKVRSAWEQRGEGTASMRKHATAAYHRAETQVQDIRASDAGKRAASAVHDLRETPAAKKAESALHDLRETPAAKKAESALADLRQREPVKKAEESARRVLHDLRTGGGAGSGGSTDDAAAS